jgi:hypothetical protein
MILPDLAYIDPGSGSLLIQGAIASIVAVSVFFRHQIARLIPALRRRSSDTPPTSPSKPVDDAAPRG